MVILKLVRRGRRHLALYDIIAANKRAKCEEQNVMGNV